MGAAAVLEMVAAAPPIKKSTRKAFKPEGLPVELSDIVHFE
jgi:hypothetical protein